MLRATLWLLQALRVGLVAMLAWLAWSAIRTPILVILCVWTVALIFWCSMLIGWARETRVRRDRDLGLAHYVDRP